MNKPKIHKPSEVVRRYSFLSIASAGLVQVFDVLQSTWLMLPRAWADSVPEWLILSMTIGFLLMGVVGSFVDQKLGDKP